MWESEEGGIAVPFNHLECNGLGLRIWGLPRILLGPCVAQIMLILCQDTPRVAPVDVESVYCKDVNVSFLLFLQEVPSRQLGSGG